jgi:hypothetical protein
MLEYKFSILSFYNPPLSGTVIFTLATAPLTTTHGYSSIKRIIKQEEVRIGETSHAFVGLINLDLRST